MANIAQGGVELLTLSNMHKTSHLAGVFDALGEDDFDNALMGFLRQIAGVEHFTAYCGATAPKVIGGASVRGPHAMIDLKMAPQHSFADLEEAQSIFPNQPSINHTDPHKTIDTDLRKVFHQFDIVDRVMVCGRLVDRWFAVSLLRSGNHGLFSDRELKLLEASAEVLISAVAKNSDIRSRGNSVSRSLNSVALIESKLETANLNLSRRELQVAARILFGLSALGIACDLDLSEQTVATYRRRVYGRLGISSKHELLQLFLSLL